MTDTMRSINPATGATLAEHPMLTSEELEGRLARAAEAAVRWRRTPVAQRAAVVARLGELLDAEKDRLGRLMTLEMGKPIQAAIDEAAKCATACRFYAEHGPGFIADDEVEDDGHRSFVTYQPLGVVLAVMPWNFPFWQVIRFAAPALVAGNVGLLKHASNVPGCALELESLVSRAGAPDGVFQALLVGSDAVAGLLADPRVAAATLTGSEGAGRSVAQHAGEHLKKTVLELGGSDAFVVMPSAELDATTRTAVRARTINNGQSCIAAKRFIVHRAVADAFLEKFVAGMRALRMGDPLDPATQLGPLASARLAAELEAQVKESVARGARLLCGGTRESPASAFFPATVLTDIPRESPAYRDELFGPVASVFVANDLDDAIRIANDTRFGLGASAWTNDPAEQERFARELEAGSVFVNDMVASDPRFPFGGVKASGYGRELSDVGLREFTNVKTVRMKRGGGGTAKNTE
ncbi:MAG TPA: NAD-dependent succinate-semialdehyde dehydrogenase [Gemmatimonadaceae bacterium]|jgi:succinate-semialdehyde dehydrogenase/glutarate-semialdehyde dehydrogenase|nr:NAD-dependent succinate-semialdehyde dehydrogenase [Gemmatimonadaceae bacterium]